MKEQEQFVGKVSLGALGLGWLWMIFSKLYNYAILSFFITPANIVLALIFFFTGRKLAWESGEWESFEAFKKKQKQLDTLAIVIWAFMIFVLLTLGLTFK